MVGPGLGAGLTQAAFRLFWITMGHCSWCPQKKQMGKAKEKKKEKSWIRIARPDLDSDTWEAKRIAEHTLTV